MYKKILMPVRWGRRSRIMKIVHLWNLPTSPKCECACAHKHACKIFVGGSITYLPWRTRDSHHVEELWLPQWWGWIPMAVEKVHLWTLASSQTMCMCMCTQECLNNIPSGLPYPSNHVFLHSTHHDNKFSHIMIISFHTTLMGEEPNGNGKCVYVKSSN